MGTPYISIVIPTYNCGKTIKQCLDSILKQSFLNYEVLIMDGFSSDDTSQICKGYVSNSIHFYQEKDTGIYDAMNKGISKARGEWIYFLGGDDVFYSDTVLQTFASATKKYPFNMFYGNVLVSGDTAWAKDQQVYDGYFSLNKLLTKNICHQAILYKKLLFNEIGNFNTKYVVCADFDLNLRIVSKYNVKYLDFTAVIFKNGGASSTINDAVFMDDFNKNVINYFYKILYRPCFKKFEHSIIEHGKNCNSAFSKFYLFSVGYYFKIQRKLGLS